MTINLGISILLLLLIIVPITSYLTIKMGTYGYLMARYKFRKDQHSNNYSSEGNSYYE
jgi:hypothetical protein